MCTRRREENQAFMPITYNDLFLDVRKQLRASGIEASTLEARELVCFGSGKTREELFRDGGLYLSAEVEQSIRALVQRHLDGEPVAYIIGEWEFYGLPLDINESVLIPRVDTEVLAGAAIEALRPMSSCRVLDLCAGSGCIGLAIAANVPGARVLLGELSENAVRICRQNIRRNQLSGRVSVMTLNALEEPPAAVGEFDCIVSNPPYIPTGDLEELDHSVKDFEPRMALDGGADGYTFYHAIIRRWRKALKSGGRLYFEVGIGQADTVLRMMRTEGFGDLEILPDDQNIPRVVFGRRLEEI